MVIGRAVMSVVALACCAWYLLGIRQANDVAAATAIVSRQTPPGEAQARRATSLLDAASTLDPDQQVNVLRAELAIDEGQDDRARQILHAVIHREVDNLQAWLVYARASSNDLIQAEAAHYVITRLVRSFPAPH